MKKFYVNFITGSILYNQIHCADEDIKFEKSKLVIRYRGIPYFNKDEIKIDKNAKIDRNFIENLVENNDFTYKLEKIVLSKYDSIEIQNRKNQIDNLKIEDCIFERKGYSIINLMICYTLPFGSYININNKFSSSLSNKKVYLEYFNFKSKEEFKKSIYNVFKDIELTDNNKLSTKSTF